MSLSARPPLRVLPCDVDCAAEHIPGATGDPLRPPDPPSFADLRRAGLVAPLHDPDRFWQGREQALASWLRDRGLRVHSVARRLGTRERTPDAVLSDHDVTLELKRSAGTATAIVRAIRMGRGQSRRVAIDVRGAEVDPASVGAAIETGVRFYGAHLDEIIVVIDDHTCLGWWNGRHTRSD